MSFFDTIKAKIFGREEPAAIRVASAPAATPTPVPGTATPPQVSPEIRAAQDAAVAAGMAAANQAIADAAAANAAAAAAKPSVQVDVAAVLDQAVAKSGQKLNWKTSIVDLLKALDLDSSLAARKELADELGYTGDKSDSATMNIWLHKQVLANLAANGGAVPDSLIA